MGGDPAWCGAIRPPSIRAIPFRWRTTCWPNSSWPRGPTRSGWPRSRMARPIRMVVWGEPRGPRHAQDRGRGGGRPDDAGTRTRRARPGGAALSPGGRRPSPLGPRQPICGACVPSPVGPVSRDGTHESQRPRLGQCRHRVLTQPVEERVRVPAPLADPGRRDGDDLRGPLRSSITGNGYMAPWVTARSRQSKQRAWPSLDPFQGVQILGSDPSFPGACSGLADRERWRIPRMQTPAGKIRRFGPWFFYSVRFDSGVKASLLTFAAIPACRRSPMPPGRSRRKNLASSPQS